MKKVILIFVNLSFIFSINQDWLNIPTTTKKYSVVKSPLKDDKYSQGLDFRLKNNSIIYNNDSDLELISKRSIPNASNLYDRNKKTVVLITCEDDGSIGSGLIIGENEIITNYHVIDGCEKIKYVLHNSKYSSIHSIQNSDIFNAKVEAVDRKRDLALLKTSDYLNNKVVFGKNWNIRVASSVFAIGHPEYYLWSFTQGVISALPSSHKWAYKQGEEHIANCIQTQTPINPGNSGGPLYNEKGELIGINTFISDGENLNFAVRLDEITDFIDKAKNGLYALENNQTNSNSKSKSWSLIKDHKLKNIFELYGSDTNNDGHYDEWLIYENYDNIPDTRMFDVNYDLKPDIIHEIVDGKYYIDNNYDGEFDRIGYDYNGDLTIDEFKDYK